MKNHLFIGLGGQGSRTLAELRKVMAQRERDRKALATGGIRWEFLAIDSSTDVKNELKCWTLFGDDLSLAQQDWLELRPINSNAVDGLSIRSDVAPWIGQTTQIRNFVDSHKIEGANQRRRFGRLLFAQNADQIRNALFQDKVPALVASSHNQCAFHIFASLGGGTGSGCIIDLITTIRTQFPQSGLSEYPIFVYVYATHNDGQAANVGYFYQNQFASLRDLNALMCNTPPHTMRLNLLGNQVAGRIYEGSEPIAQLVVTTSLNHNNISVPLPNQIRIVAESCFERIAAWTNGQMSAASQQAITGQDVLAAFPGEPLASPERSYRFSGFGMRRWEVPHQKVSELLALDLLGSCLRQMLFGNWQQNRGFQDSMTQVSQSAAARAIQTVEGIVIENLATKHQAPDLARKLRSDCEAIAQSMLKEGGSDLNLSSLETRIKSFYQKTFQGDGAVVFFQTIERDQATMADTIIQRIDQALTGFWVDPADPIALAHLPELIDSLAASLRAKLDTQLDLTGSQQRLNQLVAARHLQWGKLTGLSALVGKRSELFTAQARDLAAIYGLEIETRCDGIDRALLRSVLTKLQQLRAGYAAAQGALTDILSDTERERQDIDTELEAMSGSTGANKYEFSSSGLTTFRTAMRIHDGHQRDAAIFMRTKVHEMVGLNPLTVFRSNDVELRTLLPRELRHSAMERARSIHQALEQNDEAPKILEDSLLNVLQERFQGDANSLIAEVSDFVARAASCLHLAGGTQPTVLLGQQQGVPEMPRRILLLGLPNDNSTFAAQLKAAFIGAKAAGTNLLHDTYTHDDPTQLRLLFVDYWLAARFATVATELEKSYKTAAASGDTAYFCNLDADGEKNKRPPLFLPTPTEMRRRFEAELWLAQQNEVDVVRSDANGVFLIRKDQAGTPIPQLLGSDEGQVIASASEGTMYLLHEQLYSALGGMPASRREQITAAIQNETARVETTFGVTSKEYRNWLDLRNQLQKLNL